MQKINFEKDFNQIFWNIFGINHRVYDVKDVYRIKRDKQADEKKYNNFQNDDYKLSDNAFFELQSKEINIFKELLYGELYSKDNHTLNNSIQFYINQINNIAIHFKNRFFGLSNNDFYINMISLQVAYILEYMNNENINTNLFEESLNDKSIMPFISYAMKLNRVEKNKDFASKLVYSWDSVLKQLKERFPTKLTITQESTFITKISSWKNKKELPTFIDIYIILVSIWDKNDNKYEVKVLFIQLLLVRALLHINQRYQIDSNSQRLFLDKLETFRKKIKNCYESTESDVCIKNLQSKYVINIIDIMENESSNKGKNKAIFDALKTFIEKNHNETSYMPNLELLNEDELVVLFNKGEFQKLFKLLNREPYSNVGSVNEIVIKPTINYLKFLVSIKIGDQELIKKSFKDAKRNSPLTSLKMYDVKFNSNEFIKILDGIQDLEVCINKMNSFIKNKLSKIE